MTDYKNIITKHINNLENVKIINLVLCPYETNDKTNKMMTVIDYDKINEDEVNKKIISKHIQGYYYDIIVNNNKTFDKTNIYSRKTILLEKNIDYLIYVELIVQKDIDDVPPTINLTNIEKYEKETLLFNDYQIINKEFEDKNRTTEIKMKIDIDELQIEKQIVKIINIIK
jgi:hypothetical protein